MFANSLQKLIKNFQNTIRCINKSSANNIFSTDTQIISQVLNVNNTGYALQLFDTKLINVCSIFYLEYNLLSIQNLFSKNFHIQFYSTENIEFKYFAPINKLLL